MWRWFDAAKENGFYDQVQCDRIEVFGKFRGLI